jgi:hypothetical protein
LKSQIRFSYLTFSCLSFHRVGLPCRFVTLKRLIQLKRAAGWPKDLEAIAEVQALLEQRRKFESPWDGKTRQEPLIGIGDPFRQLAEKKTALEPPRPRCRGGDAPACGGGRL